MNLNQHLSRLGRCISVVMLALVISLSSFVNVIPAAQAAHLEGPRAYNIGQWGSIPPTAPWFWHDSYKSRQAWMKPVEYDTVSLYHVNLHVQPYGGSTDNRNWHIKFHGCITNNWTWSVTDSESTDYQLYSNIPCSFSIIETANLYSGVMASKVGQLVGDDNLGFGLNNLNRDDTGGTKTLCDLFLDLRDYPQPL